jgi:hypothetical protein
MSNFISFCSSARILFSSDKQTNSTNKNKQHKTKVSKYIKRKQISKKMAPLTEEENTGDFKDQQFGEKEVADKVVEQCES